MDYFGWFLRLWSWKSGFVHEVWGYELLLVFGFGIMVMQYGSWLGWSFRFLILKGCHLEIGVCPNFDFVDFWGKKFWSCGKSVWGLCKISILQLRGIHRFEAYKADSSEVLCDSDVHCGDQSFDDDDETALFCDAEGCCDDKLYWDCSEDGVFDVMALREMLGYERQRADAAVVELEKERLAVASAAEEAMAMILRLQNEKSLIVMEARNYKKMAELNMLYDRETMQKLRLLLADKE